MCGIAGFYLKDPTFLSATGREKLLDFLLLGIEHRGTDATGYMAATTGGKTVALKKDDIKASDFIQLREDLPEDTRMVLAHTRLATQGKPVFNENNHPVQFKTCFATHNGCIYNDNLIIQDLLDDDESIKRAADVDSIAVPMLIAQHGFDKALEVLPKLAGSWALAIADPVSNPDELLLVRGSSSPLVLIDTPQITVWASVMKAIEDAWQLSIGTPPGVKRFEWLAEGEAVTIAADGTTDIVTFMDPPEPMTRRSFSSTKQWTWGEVDQLVSGPAKVSEYQAPNDRTMCYECGEKVAFFKLTDNYTRDGLLTEWDVPVCHDCQKEHEGNLNGLTYRYGGDNTLKLRHIALGFERCELCQNATAEGFNKVLAKLCGRCLDSEPELTTFQGSGSAHEKYLKLEPGDSIPLDIRSSFPTGCESCGGKHVAFIGDDGFPVCAVCRSAEKGWNVDTATRKFDMCEGCEVHYQEGTCTWTMAGLLCIECRADADELGLGDDEDPTSAGVANFLGYLREADDHYQDSDVSAEEREIASDMSLYPPFITWLVRMCGQDHLEDPALAQVYDEVKGRYNEKVGTTGSDWSG